MGSGAKEGIQEMIIEKIAPAKLVGADYNPREIEPHQLEALKRSIDRWGFVEPVIVNKRTGLIVGGHQRTKAAIELAIEEVPVTYVDLDDDAEKALNIALNKIAGDWDEQKLSDLLADLEKSGQDLEDLGFDASELDDLLDELQGGAVELQGDLDEIPEAPADPITQPGDLWQLGEHRLLCGDSTNAEDVARLMDGETADLCFTDPPYGIEYSGTWRGVSSKDFGGQNTGKVENDHLADWREAFDLMGSSVAYVWHDHRFSSVVAESLEAAGYEVKQQIVWKKPFGVMSRQDYNWQHECAWYAIKKGHKHLWAGDKKQTTVWEATIPNHPMAPDDDSRTLHPTQKPVALAVVAIKNHKSQNVLDMFCGSGTTIIAAEQTGRKCYAMELSPAYCDVAVKRWEQATGRKAERIK